MTQRSSFRGRRRSLAVLGLGIAVLASGCGDNDGVAPPVEAPVYGLISYDLIRSRTSSTPLAGALDNAGAAEGAAAGTSIITGVNDILNIGALAYPALGPIATISSWITGAVSQASLNNEINTIFSDISALQNQVSALQTELNFLNSDFMQYVQAQTASDEHAAWVNFQDSVGTITSQSTGVFYLFQSAAGIPPTGPVDYQQLVEQIPEIDTKLTGLGDSFVTSINNLSASQLPIDTPSTDVYKSVESFSNSTVELLYQQMQDYLYVNFPEFPNQTSNIAPSVAQYNNQILYVFQISAAALQAAYTVDAAINQINYYQYDPNPSVTPTPTSSGTPTPTPTPALEMETNPYVYYAPLWGQSASANLSAYQNAQQQLAQVYAARYNQLFATTMTYLISDPPFSNFTYPSMATGDPTIDDFYAGQSYQDYFESAVPSAKMQSPLTLGQNFPKITVTNAAANTQGYVFYMYGGLNQFTACQYAFSQAQALDATNCPSVYASYSVAATPGVYDGQTLQVWFMSPSNGQPVETVETNLANRCDAGQMPSSTWNVTSAFVQTNNTAGFSCQPNQSVTPQGNAAFTPGWTYNASSSDPHNTFTWQTRNTGFLWVNGETSSLSGGNIQVETAKVTYGANIALGLNANNAYLGGLVFKVNWSAEGAEEVSNFPFYCPTYDPLCSPFTGSQGAGICLGGRYITVYQNGKENNIGYIQDNGSC